MRRAAIRVLHVAAVTASLVALSPDASAAETLAARVKVDAPADCASVASFWAAIARHTDRLREGDGAATIDVTLRASEARVTGTLHVAREREAPWQRRLVGASCAEVTDALAMITALAFDPSATTRPAPLPAPAPATATPAATSTAAPAATSTATPTPTPPGASPSPTPSPTPTAAAAPTAPATTTPTPTATPTQTAPAASPTPTPTPTPTAPPPAAAPPPAETPSPPPSPTARWRLAVGGAVGPLGLAASTATLGYAGFAELGRESGTVAPSLRLGVRYAEDSATIGAVGVALSWTVAHSSVCPLRASLGGGVTLRPCAGIDVGVVGATPRGLVTATGTSRAWVAPLVAGRVSWSVLQLVFLEGELGLSVPLTRDEFAADPSVSLYRAPALVPMASLGAGVRFP